MRTWTSAAGVLLTLALALPLTAETHAPGPVVFPTNSPAAEQADTNAAPADSLSPAQALAPAGGPVHAPSGDPSLVSPPSSPAGTLVSPSSPNAPIPPYVAPSPGRNSPGAPGHGDDIYDIRPPFFYLSVVVWPWIVLGLLILLSLGILLWVWIRSLQHAKAKSAYELTLERLEKARALLNEHNPEPYAVAVSEIIRHYLGQRFNTPSTRRTTEEFLRQMKADRATPLAQHRELLQSFLEACDLVKFAHYQPARNELEQVQERAVNFVTATKPLEGAPA